MKQNFDTKDSVSGGNSNDTFNDIGDIGSMGASEKMQVLQYIRYFLERKNIAGLRGFLYNSMHLDVQEVEEAIITIQNIEPAIYDATH